MLKSALTLGRRRRWEKFPGFGFEKVLDGVGGFGLLGGISAHRGTGPPRFENVRSFLGVARRGSSWFVTTGAGSVTGGAWSF